MARFSLPPADVSWLDRAQSCDGVFPLSAGFVLAELDGETYAVSGRYCGIPDSEETARLVAALHEERGFVLDESGEPMISEGDSPAWLLAQVKILARMRPLDRRTRWTFSRYV